MYYPINEKKGNSHNSPKVKKRMSFPPLDNLRRSFIAVSECVTTVGSAFMKSFQPRWFVIAHRASSSFLPSLLPCRCQLVHFPTANRHCVASLVSRKIYPLLHKLQRKDRYTQLPLIRDSVNVRLVCPKIWLKIRLVVSHSCHINFASVNGYYDLSKR